MPSANASRDLNAPLTSTKSVTKERAPISLTRVMSQLRPARLPLEVSLWVAHRLATELVESHEGVGGAIVHGRLSAEHVQLGFDGSVTLDGFGDEPPGADVLTDVHLLGGVLYELCSGMSVAEATAQGGGKLPAPSDLNPGLDPSLDDLLLSALADDAAERPYSVREILGRIGETYKDIDLTPNPGPLVALLSSRSFEPAKVAAPVVVVAAVVAPTLVKEVVAAPESELELSYSEEAAAPEKKKSARPELRLAAAPGEIVSVGSAVRADRSHAIDVLPAAAPIQAKAKAPKKVIVVQAAESDEDFEQDEDDYLGARERRFGGFGLQAKLAALKPFATRRNMAIAGGALLMLLFVSTRGSSHSTVSIRSEPSGASVTIDGRSVGQTPLTLHKVKAGQHEVKVQKEGFEAQASDLTVRAGSEPELQIALKAKVVAALVPAHLPGVQVVQGNFKTRNRPNDKKLAMGETH